MMELCSGQLRLYSAVSETQIEWLWYPYIPFGKLTLVQGDPGCGKSTLMMNIISAVSNGGMSPDGRKFKKPMHAIYQCSEDGLSDTIKPRLTAAGANCSNIAFLDEEANPVTLADETLRRAIADFNAKLLILDPVQAYLGDADIASATGMRKVLRQLAIWASLYDCAIVLIGHQNKKESAKTLYRSLGSIDLVAAARSVLQIEHVSGKDNVAVIHHVKSSLTPKGKDLFFTIDPDKRIEWLNLDSMGTAQEEAGTGVTVKLSKQAQAADMLRVILSDGPVKATEIQRLFDDEDISDRTIMMTKKTLGIHSLKKDGVWYWELPPGST